MENPGPGDEIIAPKTAEQATANATPTVTPPKQVDQPHDDDDSDSGLDELDGRGPFPCMILALY